MLRPGARERAQVERTAAGRRDNDMAASAAPLPTEKVPFVQVDRMES
jgi:hypothetical protein